MPYKFNPFIKNLDWFEKSIQNSDSDCIGVNPYLFPYSMDGSLTTINVFYSAEEIFNALSWTIPEGTEVIVDDSDWKNTILCKFNGIFCSIQGRLPFEQPLNRVHVYSLYFVHNPEHYEFRVEAVNNANRYSLRKLSPDGTLQIYKYWSGSETILTSTTFPNSAGYKVCSFYAGNIPYVKQTISLRSESQNTTSMESSDTDITSFDAINLFMHSRVEGNNLNIRIVPPLIIRGI